MNYAQTSSAPRSPRRPSKSPRSSCSSSISASCAKPRSRPVSPSRLCSASLGCGSRLMGLADSRQRWPQSMATSSLLAAADLHRSRPSRNPGSHRAHTAACSSIRVFTAHAGEYVAVVLMAAAGGLLIAAAQDLLVIFIGLELLSLGLYILTAFAKTLRQERRSRNEVLPLRRHVRGLPALRLQLSLRNHRIDKPPPDSARGLQREAAHAAPLLYVAIVLIATGLGFKVAAVPFHLWAPDTYEGAPAPAAAFIASVSKVASFALLISISTAALHVFDGRRFTGDVDGSALLAGTPRPVYLGLRHPMDADS